MTTTTSTSAHRLTDHDNGNVVAAEHDHPTMMTQHEHTTPHNDDGGPASDAAGGAPREQGGDHGKNGEGHDTTMYGGPSASDTPGDKALSSTAARHCSQGWTVVLQARGRWHGWNR
jgi:hypothetical protein